MVEIRVGGETLDMSGGFSINVEDSNPIFNERGSQSLPATVPATSRNLRLTGFPTCPDAALSPMNGNGRCVVADGIYIRSGKINVTEASSSEGISFNIGFDNSIAYQEWAGKALADLKDLPVLAPDIDRQEDLMEILTGIYTHGDPQIEPLALFPLAVGCESVEESVSDNEKRTLDYWELLNMPTDHGLEPPNKVFRVIDGVATEVSVPNYYGVTPFIRVWKMLELVFGDLGYRIESNPFREDVELARLVVLNNSADVCCRGSVKYSELMPDVTVSEFMNALYVRFGLVYNINAEERVVSLAFIKDVIARSAAFELEPIAENPPKIIYDAPQYVKLSAQTSLDGAAVATERFEDYVKGFPLDKIMVGLEAANWEWDRGRGSWNLHNGITPIAPSGGSSAPSGGVALSDAGRLALELPGCGWYKLDCYNETKKESSSSFFMWDPAPADLDPLELSSDDEWVPLRYVDVKKDHKDPGLFSGYVPFFSAGSRHYHSYVKSSDGSADTEKGVTTPLAFVFALTGSEIAPEGTIGRTTPYSEMAAGEDLGRFISFPDGSEHTLSLLFQFKGGLFDRFWRGYDEILRHNGRTIEISARFRKQDLMAFDMFTPVTVKGVRCLVSTLSYSLPAAGYVRVDMSLIPVVTQGIYDISSEQNIPDVFNSSGSGI